MPDVRMFAAGTFAGPEASLPEPETFRNVGHTRLHVAEFQAVDHGVGVRGPLLMLERF